MTQVASPVASAQEQKTDVVLLNSNSTTVNGELITKAEDLLPALKMAVIGALYRAQGVKSVLTDEGERVPCRKPDVVLRGHEVAMEIPKWKIGEESHAEWQKRAKIGARNFLSRAAAYMNGDLKSRIEAFRQQFTDTWDEMFNGAKTEL